MVVLVLIARTQNKDHSYKVLEYLHKWQRKSESRRMVDAYSLEYNWQPNKFPLLVLEYVCICRNTIGVLTFETLYYCKIF